MTNRHWIDINRNFSYERNAFHTPSETARKLYYYVQGVGHFICENGFRLKRKELRSILIKKTLSGTGMLEYRGMKYELNKSQLMIIDCYDFQEYYTYDCDRWESIWIHFYGGASSEYFNYIYENYGPVINMPEDDRTENCIDEILGIMEKGDPQSEIKISPLIFQLFSIILLAVSAEANPLKNMEYHRYVKAALEYIENNCQTKIDVTNIARAAGLSASHFSHVFKRFTGFSPHEYVVKYRVNKAKNLLNISDMSIEEIAYETGFTDAGSFIRTFKKFEEITPLKYRNSFSSVH